jgi:hypothetical protein
MDSIKINQEENALIITKNIAKSFYDHDTAIKKT